MLRVPDNPDCPVTQGWPVVNAAACPENCPARVAETLSEYANRCERAVERGLSRPERRAVCLASAWLGHLGLFPRQQEEAA